MEDARGNPTPSVNGTCQQPAKNIAWADGHWGIYGRVNIHVCKMHAGLLHLLSPDAFSELKMVTNALMVRFLPRTLLESLQLNLGDRRGRGKGEEGNGSGEGVKMEALERCRDGWKRGRIGRKYNIKSVNYSKAMQTVSVCGFYARRFSVERNSYGNVAGRVSVTLRYCIKTAKPIRKLFRPSESPIILVSWDPAPIQNSTGNPFSGGVKYTAVGKLAIFVWFSTDIAV